MYDRITELPFIASTTGDGVLATLFGARRKREKLRERARMELGVRELGAMSLGRAGRARIEPAFLLPYVRLIGMDRAAGRAFERDMQRYGLLSLGTPSGASVLGGEVVKLLKLVQETSLLHDVTLAKHVNSLLAKLTLENNRMWKLAEAQREKWRCFSQAERRFTRLPGTLVRIEDDEALLNVWNEEAGRQELRSVSASHLKYIDLGREDNPVILYETEYSPGIRILSVVPAVVRGQSASRATLKEQAELRALESPLPTIAELEAAERRS